MAYSGDNLVLSSPARYGERREELADEQPDCADLALADVSGYVAWLAGLCRYAQPQHTAFVPNFSDLDMTQKTVPMLVALQLYPNHKVSGAASYELRRRWLAHRGIDE